jgi:hypothetical protein
MAQMMAAQGQQPTPPWTIIEQLRQKYDVKEVPTDANDINDVDGQFEPSLSASWFSFSLTSWAASASVRGRLFLCIVLFDNALEVVES